MKKGKHPTSNIAPPTSNDGEVVVWELKEGNRDGRQFNLEERLLEFSSAVIDLSESLPRTRAGTHVPSQILRSGTSPYPNHGEAEDAESREDFIHKLNLCLKELRKTRHWARLIQRKGWGKAEPALVFILPEAEELIRIFFASVQTDRRNALAERRQPAARYPAGNAG